MWPTLRSRSVLWHGELDDSCPLAHAEWLHDRLPHSRLEVQLGEGHLAIGVSRTREMFGALTTAVAEI